MISIITSIFSNDINKNFFSSILDQKKEVFELIILTNNISAMLANKINEIERNSNIKLLVIFTTRKIGFNELVIEGVKLAKGTHAVIANTDEPLPKTFVFDITRVIDKNKEVDILEFKASFKGFEKWTPKKRCNLKPNHPFLISDYPKILAFSFPFISNKIFKVSLAQFVSNKTTYMETNTHLSIQFLYMLFLYAKIYIYSDIPYWGISIKKEDLPNYLNFYKEWKDISSKYSLENKLLQEIEYSQIYSTEIMMPALYSHKKLLTIPIRFGATKNISFKIYEKNNRLRIQNFPSFKYTNKYMLLNLLETEYLSKSHPPNEWNKILKIFRE